MAEREKLEATREGEALREHIDQLESDAERCVPDLLAECCLKNIYQFALSDRLMETD